MSALGEGPRTAGIDVARVRHGADHSMVQTYRPTGDAA